MLGAVFAFPLPESPMPRRLPLVLLFILLLLWLAASYGVRYALMEDAQWVGVCSGEVLRWECQVRSSLGYLIYFGIIGWTALAVSLVAFCVPGRVGRVLAVLALLCGIPALVLYSASMAVFAVVIAGLRLVRATK